MGHMQWHAPFTSMRYSGQPSTPCNSSARQQRRRQHADDSGLGRKAERVLKRSMVHQCAIHIPPAMNGNDNNPKTACKIDKITNRTTTNSAANHRGCPLRAS